MEEMNFDELHALADEKQYRSLKEKLIEMNEVDIASFMEELDSEKTVVVFRTLPKEIASGCVRLPSGGEAAAHHYQHYG